jgi:hypothetical protein
LPTITVNSAATFVPGDRIRIDGEEMLVVNVGGNTLVVLRGLDGTTPTAHGANAAVYLATDQRGQVRSTPPSIGAV